MRLDRTERRILGALVEKRWATPELYPLTLKALVAACNQKSNRDPVFALNDFEIEGALSALKERRLVEDGRREGGHTVRWSELLSEQLGIDRRGAAVLAELMLRGPQTCNELARRAARMAPIASPDDAGAILDELVCERLVELMPRAPGQRHARYRHLLAAEGEEPAAAPTSPDDPRTLVHRYYDTWLESDRDTCRRLLADDLSFRSPTDEFASADAFLAACWKYAEGFHRMEYEHEVYGNDCAMLSYVIPSAEGGRRVVEYLEIGNGRIARVHVVSIQALEA